MDLIFNELSLEPPMAARVEARAVMIELVETLATALDSRLIKALRTDSQFVLRTLCPEYTVSHWLVDGSVDREAKRLMQTVASKAPFVEALADELQGERLAEFSCRGQLAIGLGVAVLRSEAALSMNRHEWRVDPLPVHARYLGANDFEEEEEQVSHVYSVACLGRRGEWLQQRARLAVRSGADVLADTDGIFHHLVFTDNAQAQLRRLGGSEPEFNAIVQHLSALNRQAEQWTTGLFAAGYPFPCSPESESTLNMFPGERTFRCPDGHNRLFSWHSKINIGAIRIYFWASHPGEPLLIGYVGRHLRTATE